MHWTSPYRVHTAPPPADMGPHCTETHSHGTSLYRDPPHTCSNLFNLDLTVQGPPPLPDMFKLVHYAVCMVASTWFTSYWNAFLLLPTNEVAGKECFQLSVHKKGTSRVTITQDALDFIVQAPCTWSKPHPQNVLNVNSWVN